MSINKNAFIRYKVLDNCFRNPGRNYYIEDLVEECNKVLREIDPDCKGISKRQIYEDIKFMESSEGMNICLDKIKDGRRTYFRYEDMSFSINNTPLNEVEITQLKDAIGILSHFRGLPQFDFIDELIPKLRQGIRPSEKSNIVMSFDSNQYLKGIENLGLLHNAIFYKKVLQISYKPYDADAPYIIVFHPYFLKQYNNRWFLFGYNPDAGKADWNLALDRITEIKEVKEKYIENDSIDWQEYFEDIIGVTKPENAKSEKITLHFFGKTGSYIETKPLHGSQKSKWISEDVFEVNLELLINYELERLIISYGDDVAVINPENLRNRIAEKLNKAASLYIKSTFS